MPSGRLGAVNLLAATDTTLFAVPSGKLTSFSINFCNRGSAAASVRLSISDAATPAASEYLEYETSIPAFGVLERGGLMADSGKFIVVRSSIASVNCVAYGVEE